MIGDKDAALHPMTKRLPSGSPIGDWVLLALGCLVAVPGVGFTVWLGVRIVFLIVQFGVPASNWWSAVRVTLTSPFGFAAAAGALLIFIGARRLLRRRAAGRRALRDLASVFDG